MSQNQSISPKDFFQFQNSTQKKSHKNNQKNNPFKFMRTNKKTYFLEMNDEKKIKEVIPKIQIVLQQNINLFCNLVVILAEHDPGVKTSISEWYYYDAYSILKYNNKIMWYTWNSLYQVIDYELKWWKRRKQNDYDRKYVEKDKYRSAIFSITKDLWNLKNELSNGLFNNWTDFTGSTDSFDVYLFHKESFKELSKEIARSVDQSDYDFSQNIEQGMFYKGIRIDLGYSISEMAKCLKVSQKDVELFELGGLPNKKTHERYIEVGRSCILKYNKPEE